MCIMAFELIMCCNYLCGARGNLDDTDVLGSHLESSVDEWFMSATNNKPPASIQPQRTWFSKLFHAAYPQLHLAAPVPWKALSRNLFANVTDGSSSAGTCYMLHAILVMIYVVLVIVYIAHWEHRATLPFTQMNNDFWSVVLSASLQAFYTVYTAVLLFFTQRLAMSRSLVHRLKLTTIHDISGAWSGLGSALSSVWQQTDIPASWWMISTVTAYLVCISVLHITSSTLLQIQTFNTSMTTSVPTMLAWPYDSSIFGTYETNWASITASLPVVSQLSGLVSVGLSNATVYDTPYTNSVAGNATVDATTISSRCGLLPNLTYSADAGMLSVNSTIGDGYGTFISMGASYPWPDQVQVLSYNWVYPSGNVTPPDTNPGVILMVSTLLDIEPSIQKEVAVPISVEFVYNNSWVPYVLEVYFVQCSLSAVTAEAVLDMQANSLQNPVPMSQPSTQWEIKEWSQWASDSWQAWINSALANQVGSGYSFSDLAGPPSGNPPNEPSISDEHIMSLVGLNLAVQALGRGDGISPFPTFVLSPDKLEAAIAQVTAQLVWTAGRIGTTNGGFQYGGGTASVNEQIIALRLNVNLLPLLFATSASVIMMILALSMTRAFDASSDSQAAIPNTGVLQLLWLGRHSAPVNEAMDDVENPTEANLRRAGMIDVRFAKTISDESELGGFS
ncbi:hypothetical protein DEU56DRAFT_900243 [Suillus clintonianus]|uniref:uncharacterized protein n=1 Tax=Suillus clintonianus TaxID=1904413 RepID=UPI001B86CC98|nr:uncharacterized protein DEU56DRAFT_900243 [Suillus clintonianus]KAG2143695.1 hypothetical protein DEU56DRAFT_900243 [Suillus clintonianus]